MGKCVMNCSTCSNSTKNNQRARESEGYCYMFKEEPEGQCFQHTSYKDTSVEAFQILFSFLKDKK